MKSEIIKIYKNEKDGIETHVAKIATGFSVTLKDTDADQFLEINLIYKDEADAHKKADEIDKGYLY